jgi:hypothetical protein
VVFLRKLVLLEELRPAAVKVVREVEFRAGLNIVWADPHTAEAAAGGVRVSGHSAGKTTLCRILRWLLGEGHFAPPALEARIATELKDGWAVLAVEVDGQPWLTGRRFFHKADHCAVPGMTFDELFANGWPEPCPAAPFLAELRRATIGHLARQRLPGRDEDIPWTHVLGWLARDQETALVDVAAWRSSAKAPGERGPTVAERHLLLRLVLDMLSEPEGRELEGYAADEAERAEQREARTALADRSEQACLRLGVIVPGGGKPVAGELLLPPARQVVNAKRTQLQSMEADLAANPTALAEQNHRQALTALASARRDVRTAERDVQKTAETYGEHEKLRHRVEKELTQLALKVPPGLCGATRDEARAARCTAFKESPTDFDQAALLAEFTRLRDAALAEWNNAKQEVEDARQPLADLERNERALAQHLADAKAEREALVAAAASLATLLKSEEALLTEAETAHIALAACDARISELSDELTSSRQRQRDLRASHLSTRLAFSQCFADVLCFLLGPETNGRVEFSDEGEFVPVAESREPMSSGAIDALTVVALDLAAMLWSVTGHGHHPRLCIHDSPKVADMAPALYAPLFDLAVQAEQDSGGEPTFQYILTTTEPPPTSLQETKRVVLKLDASQPNGRLFKRDFKSA